MPANFPEAWSKIVRERLTSLTNAPWLKGVEELDVEVTVMGEGSASEQNLIHIPIALVDPKVLIDNTTYPLQVVSYDDTGVTLRLRKFQTEPTSVSDDQIEGASYSKIDTTTRGHVRNIIESKYQIAIHALAPDNDTATTPIVKKSDNANDVYKSIVALKDKFDQLQVPAEGRVLVLSSDDHNALLLDRERYGNLLSNINTGETAPVISGFNVFTYLGNPYFTTAGVKKAYGSIPDVTDARATVAFSLSNSVQKTGKTKQYFRDSSIDPENQTNVIAYRHYFIACPVEKKWLGAII
ncbi:hypothetical protein [Empedobacter sp. GD03797]|uniref:phage major capsid protein n=1 Tax=Empedobacter sp. GD03797 TaxID=2975382 RepID=UPI002446E857|nr:hypothetical protein [Empedobacter sp. GD03797]MDH1880936.1 hypothetical protein [Empedobacter sp. GD03797]